ncbi:MAG: D-aminoacylase [Acidimicrobiia bacterium]
MRNSLFLRGGSIVDGTGTPPRRGDLLIDDGLIAALLEPGEPVPDGDHEVIDVSGRMVCPGFIDAHSHDDLAVVARPDLDFKVSQGVTTVIVGNCGLGAVPITKATRSDLLGPEGRLTAVLGTGASHGWETLDDYAEAVEDASPSVNVGVLAPHNVVRQLVCGAAERAATVGEVSQMCDVVTKMVGAGALGLSTGLAYSPGRAADRAELFALARAAVHAGGVYASHIRDEADHVNEATAEAVDIGEHAGHPAHISHLKALGRSNWGKVGQLLDQIEAAGATCDAYPYTAASTFLREALVAGGATTPIPPEEVFIAYSANHPSTVGRNLRDLSEEWGITVETVVTRLETPTPGTSVVYFGMSDQDVATVLADPRCMFGTDGVPTLDGAPHPRLYGTFPRVLGHMVRDQRVLSFTEAIRKATSLPAETFGIVQRGRIERGWHADITVVDPARVTDTADYRHPKRYATGIDLVIVNGRTTWRAGEHTGAAAGRIIRHP